MCARLPLLFTILLTVWSNVRCNKASDASSHYAEQPNAAADILRIAYAYPDGGAYVWRDAGVPEDITQNGVLILPKDPRGTFCCGYTFAVVVKAARERKLLGSVSPDQLKQFQKEWYGVAPYSPKRGSAMALENLHIGRSIAMSDARAGDFVNFSRHKSGHSVVFLEWLKLNGKPIGIRYRSSQPSTNGIGDVIEFFDTSGISGGEVREDTIVVSRLNA